MVRARFIFPGAQIPKADASEAVRLILAQLKIVADERVLDFKTDYLTQASFCKALEKLTGSDLGWRALIGMYERAEARARLWADPHSPKVTHSDKAARICRSLTKDLHGSHVLRSVLGPGPKSGQRAGPSRGDARSRSWSSLPTA